MVPTTRIPRENNYTKSSLESSSVGKAVEPGSPGQLYNPVTNLATDLWLSRPVDLRSSEAGPVSW